MARVTFTQRFDYHPRPDTWITYYPGSYDTVPRSAANQAIAEGKATEKKTPIRRPPAKAK